MADLIATAWYGSAAGGGGAGTYDPSLRLDITQFDYLHGQVGTSAGHTIHHGTNKQWVNEIDADGATPGTNALKLGPSNASGIELGSATIDTTVKGSFTVTGGTTHNGNVTINGDLEVTGTTSAISTETLNVAANHIYSNDGYTGVGGETGGIVVNYKATATTTAVTAFASVTGDLTVTSSASFAIGDLIQVSGSTSNDGLYEVTSKPDATTLRIASPTVDYVLNTVEDESASSGSVHKVNVSIIQAKSSDGTWQVGQGSTSSLSFTDLATTTGSTLTAAYTAGNTLTTSVTEGNLIFTGTEAFQVTTASMSVNVAGTVALNGATGITLDSAAGISLDAGAASNFTVDGGTLTFSTTTSGSLVVTSVGALTLTGAAASTWSTSSGLLTIDGGSGLKLSSSSATVPVSLEPTATVGGEAIVQLGSTADFGIVWKAGAPSTDAYNKGTLWIDQTSGALYINQGTSVTPQWVKVGTQS